MVGGDDVSSQVSYIGVVHFFTVVHVGYCDFALANIVVIVNVVRQATHFYMDQVQRYFDTASVVSL